jgi:hypothetical protein
LSDGLTDRVAGDGRPADLEKFREDLERIACPGNRAKGLQGCITKVAGWMAGELGDGDSHACHCDVLQKVRRGERDREIVFRAFSETRAAFLAGGVGKGGARFLRTMEAMEAALIPDAELLAEHATMPMPPKRALEEPWG